MKETRIFDILNNYPLRNKDQKDALAQKEGKVWKKYSIEEYIETTRKLSYSLIELGIKAGDKVAIIGDNCVQWNMMDMAILQVGAITVPVYPTISEEDYTSILNDSGVKMVMMEGASVISKIEHVSEQVPRLKLLFTFKKHDRYPSFAQLVELGQVHPHETELKARMEAVKPTDCATIIYTSGTTGKPKGVMLSHQNFLGQIAGLESSLSKDSKTAFSFLPICHAFERMLVYLYQYHGMTIYYAESMATIASDMREIHPTMMSVVPRILEKMYDKIIKSGAKLSKPQRLLFDWAIKVAERYEIDPKKRSLKYQLELRLADRLIFKKIRESLGAERFDIIVSGAASLQPKIARFFNAIKMPVYEGYGLTETSPVITTNDNGPDGLEAGTVGRPLKGVEVRIANNGEVLCKGHNVMMGYHNDEKLTQEVIDSEGWFHTGDLGKINESGRLILTGRLKNLFKTSLGKYINPQLIEDKFAESQFIENIVVFGESEKYPAALIVPNFGCLKEWCSRNGLKYVTPSEIIQSKEVKEFFAKEIKKLNAFFGETEKIKKYELIADEWSVANGILTPTLKVKRKIVQKIYEMKIRNLFVKVA